MYLICLNERRDWIFKSFTISINWENERPDKSFPLIMKTVCKVIRYIQLPQRTQIANRVKNRGHLRSCKLDNHILINFTTLLWERLSFVMTEFSWSAWLRQSNSSSLMLNPNNKWYYINLPERSTSRKDRSLVLIASIFCINEF